MDTPAGLISALSQEGILPGSAPPSHRASASLTNIPSQTAGIIPSNPTSARKLAAFQLQSLISDPSFADQFLSLGGFEHLRQLVLKESGNTLAYGLNALSRLVELDVGISSEAIGPDALDRIVALVADERLINILRGAMGLLVAVVSGGGVQVSDRAKSSVASASLSSALAGYRTIYSATQRHTSFFSSLGTHLSGADHGLSTSALDLTNGLIRSALAASPQSPIQPILRSGASTSGSNDWAGLFKQLQDAGVIKTIYAFAHSENIDNDRSPGLAEFSRLTKRMIGRWRSMRVDERISDHVRALGSIYSIAKGGNDSAPASASGSSSAGTLPQQGLPALNTSSTDGWRRIGFLSGSGGRECATNPAGYLGLLDLSEFASRNSDFFANTLAEQAFQPEETRCPIGRASLAATEVIFEQFCEPLKGKSHTDELENISSAGVENMVSGESARRRAPAPNPLILHWPRLHAAALLAFIRLWKETGAEITSEDAGDFDRVKGLLKVLVAEVASQHGPDDSNQEKGKTNNKSPKSNKVEIKPADITAVERSMSTISLYRLRARQAETLNGRMSSRWAGRLAPVQRELENEALQFVREQRIRCLLAGGWFSSSTQSPAPPNEAASTPPLPNGSTSGATTSAAGTPASVSGTAELVVNHRYARLASNRRYLHWADFPASSPEAEKQPTLPITALSNVLDLGIVSAVVSNTCATPTGMKTVIFIRGDSSDRGSISGADNTATNGTTNMSSLSDATDILLELHPPTPAAASEWLDGLLMLLHQQPITAATANLVSLLVDTGLRVRLLNVPLENEDDDVPIVSPEDTPAGKNDNLMVPDSDQDESSLMPSPDTPHPVDALRDGRPLRAHPVRKEGGGKIRASVRGVEGTLMDLMTVEPKPTNGALPPIVWPGREGTEEPYWYSVGGVDDVTRTAATSTGLGVGTDQ